MTYQSYLEELREVIRRVHGVDSEHVRTIAVKETIEGQPLWDGLVELFELKGHASATRAYAWADDKSTHPSRDITVLDMHPIKSAQDAVRAALVQEFMSLELAYEKRKVERPPLPTVATEGRIVRVRFKAEELKAMEVVAKASNQTISEWVRNTIQATLP
jgi:hypothetical protein